MTEPRDPPSVPAAATAFADDVAHVHALRVYWEDTDAGGIVFYANYLKFFERARTEWLRAKGVEQQALRDATGAMFVVTSTALRYLRPARLDDRLDITVVVRHAGRVAIEFTQAAWCAGVLLCEGSIRIACVDAATLAPRRIPEAVACLL